MNKEDILNEVINNVIFDIENSYNDLDRDDVEDMIADELKGYDDDNLWRFEKNILDAIEEEVYVDYHEYDPTKDRFYIKNN